MRVNSTKKRNRKTNDYIEIYTFWIDKKEAKKSKYWNPHDEIKYAMLHRTPIATYIEYDMNSDQQAFWESGTYKYNSVRQARRHLKENGWILLMKFFI